jgi:hypothetical protein
MWRGAINRPDDDDWYRGEISEYNAGTRKHCVAYEDGDEEWVDLAQERFEFVHAGNFSSATHHKYAGPVICCVMSCVVPHWAD